MALPSGMRRFRLDPPGYARLRAKTALRSLSVSLPVLGAVAVGNAALGVWSAEPGACLFGVLFAGILYAAVRRASGPELVTYELLIGPRVLRRTLPNTQPAEVLRPEVTSIVETNEGLFVCCARPSRALFVTRALDGYDDVRAELATWTAIEPLRGWAAWRRGWRETQRQGARHAVAGTALADDASLREELETVRNIGDAGWRKYSAVPAHPWGPRGVRRMLALWVLLILMFLVIWQVLAPEMNSTVFRARCTSRWGPT